MPRIQKDEIAKKDIIGKGMFGVVWLGHCRGMEVAVKILHTQDMDDGALAEFEKEVSFMRQLRHPNIVLFMGACLEPGHLAIVTEYLSKGDLHTIIHDPRYQLSFVTKCKMAKDITSGMAWLHNFNPKIIHRDLKPTNLLVDENFRVKLCDFGLSVCNRKNYIQDTDRAIGTPLWMAPEVLTGQPLDEKADVYAYGIVLWELFTGNEPYAEHTQYKTFVKAVCQQGARPAIPGDMYPPLAKLIEESWHTDPAKRPDMKLIVPRITSIMVAGLWVEHWHNTSSVPFSDFAEKFYSVLNTSYNMTGIEYKCLERILGTAEDETEQCVVKLERLALVLAWIGPVDLPGRPSWLVRLVDLMKQPWFYGDKNRVEIESWLKGASKDGEYLVRFSTTEPIRCPFTISVSSKKGKKKPVPPMVNHIRVFYEEGQYFIYKPPPKESETVKEKTLELLIKKVKDEKVLGMKDVCSKGCSPYADLFPKVVPQQPPPVGGMYFPVGGKDEGI